MILQKERMVGKVSVIQQKHWKKELNADIAFDNWAAITEFVGRSWCLNPKKRKKDREEPRKNF